MAWRIEESVIRGEIDNSVRGCVTGRIWLAGCPEPVELALTGNCWRDLAGRRLEFTNPEPKPGLPVSFVARQEGAVGDITASRKVKIPDIPLDQIGEYHAARKPFPWHWGNSLYLEWFSESNGRTVIESASYELKITGEAAWKMTPEEEESQRRANSETTTRFIKRLGEATPAGQPHEDTGWDEKPQTEGEAERMQFQSDRLGDRIQARLTREGEGADYEKILHEEIERMRQERGEPGPAPEQLARNAEWLDEMNRAAEEAVNDPGLREDAEREHPLAVKARELALQMMSEPEERGWVTEHDSEEHPVADLIGAVMKASAKLAGALNGDDWPPEVEFCAGAIVRLKKARVYLDDALRAMESCQEQKLTDTAWLGVVMVEVIDLAHEADILIAELRARLERGTD